MIGKYVIGGVRDFSFTTYLKALKVKYGTWELFIQANEIHWVYDPNKEIMQESWDQVEPLTVQEAFAEDNQEKRRALFGCLGAARVFGEMKPELIDRTVLKIENLTWDENNNPVKKSIEDVYELYQIEESKLFPPEVNVRITTNAAQYIKVVRCWCTTTGREYWIFVEENWWDVKGRFTNAIQAISWTFRVGVAKEDILELYRQGDCLVTKARDKAKSLPEEMWYHLDEHTYRNKLVAQS
jgi:hypothetical protein